jgi:hypothetical protein
MKNKNVHAVEMTREIRDKVAALYWKDKREYLRKAKEAAKKLQAMRSMKKVRGGES